MGWRHGRHGRHGWHRRRALLESRRLRLQRGRQELVDACRLWVKRRWLEAVVSRRLRLERSPWWVGKWTAVLEALLKARLLVSGLHRCLESRWLCLLERSKASLLRLLEPCWLRHQPILLEVVPRVLLWEARHLLLHPLHVLHVLHVLHILQALSRPSNLGLHVGASEPGHLGCQRWGRAKSALLGVLWGRRRSLGRRCNETPRVLLLRSLRTHSWWPGVGLRHGLDGSNLVEERHGSSGRLWLLCRRRCRLGSFLSGCWGRWRCRLGRLLGLERRHVQERELAHGASQWCWLWRRWSCLGWGWRCGGCWR
jgi:hypothetical protein